MPGRPTPIKPTKPNGDALSLSPEKKEKPPMGYSITYEKKIAKFKKKAIPIEEPDF